MVPDEFKGDVDKWRLWKDDVMDFLDTQSPGMIHFLKAISDLRNNPIDQAFAQRYASLGDPRRS